MLCSHIMSTQPLHERFPLWSLSSGANSEYDSGANSDYSATSSEYDSPANLIDIVDEVEPPTPAYIPLSNNIPPPTPPKPYIRPSNNIPPRPPTQPYIRPSNNIPPIPPNLKPYIRPSNNIPPRPLTQPYIRPSNNIPPIPYPGLLPYTQLPEFRPADLGQPPPAIWTPGSLVEPEIQLLPLPPSPIRERDTLPRHSEVSLPSSCNCGLGVCVVKLAEWGLVAAVLLLKWIYDGVVLLLLVFILLIIS